MKSMNLYFFGFDLGLSYTTIREFSFILKTERD